MPGQDGRNLYEMEDSRKYWLDPQKYLDKEIIDKGVFEEMSTSVVKKLVKEGDIVLDVGANIGYYTVMFSKLVGENGKVYAFEPTEHYGKVLRRNIEENQIGNCEVFSLGLSDKAQELTIKIGTSSATLHWVSNDAPSDTETIKMVRLDDFVKEHDIQKVDFIKIDVDGHEPFFLEGAWETLDRFDPVVLLEVNHANYLEANVTAWDFYETLKKRGYLIYHENGLREITNRRDFLVLCGNFAYSANIIISRTRMKRDE